MMFSREGNISCADLCPVPARVGGVQRNEDDDDDENTLSLPLLPHEGEYHFYNRWNPDVT